MCREAAVPCRGRLRRRGTQVRMLKNGPLDESLLLMFRLRDQGTVLAFCEGCMLSVSILQPSGMLLACQGCVLGFRAVVSFHFGC